MKIGLLGLPKSGKTTLFNLLTGQSVATSSFGATRGEMHAGVARVPDARVDRLTALFTPKKTTTASFEVVDLAGITKGERAAFDAKEFRSADALLHVVRAFSGADGAPPPRGRRRGRSGDGAHPRRPRGGGAAAGAAGGVVEEKPNRAGAEGAGSAQRLKPELESETPLRAVSLTEDEARLIRGFTFLSQKPILHCLNLDEKEIARGAILVESFGLGAARRSAGHALRLGLGGDRDRSRAARGRGAGGLPRRPRPRRAGHPAACSPTATRCWGCSPSSPWARTRCGRGRCRGHPRPGRGGRHPLRTSRAASSAPRWWATTSWSPPMAPWPPCAERGQFRLEGKEYVVQDGEICHFRFNVAK